MLKSIAACITKIVPASDPNHDPYDEDGFDARITTYDGKQYVIWVDHDEYLSVFGENPCPTVPDYNINKLKQDFDVVIRHNRLYIGMDGPAYGTRFEINSKGLFSDEDGTHRYANSVSSHGGITEVILRDGHGEITGSTICCDTDQYDRKYGRNLAIYRALESGAYKHERYVK